MEKEKKKTSIAAIIFGILAIIAGLNAFLVAGFKGHSAGWEMMAIYSPPAVVFAIVAIAIRRNALSIVAVVFGLIAIGSFFLGA